MQRYGVFFNIPNKNTKIFKKKRKKVCFCLIFADSGTFSALLEFATMEASTATTTRRASHPRKDHHHRRRALNQGGHLLRLSPMSDQGGHPWPPMEGGRPPSHPHHLKTVGADPATLPACMCADMLAYVGAYVRICACRGAGAYTHGRAHPRGRTHDLSVAAGLGFVYGMFIFIGTVFCRKLPL